MLVDPSFLSMIKDPPGPKKAAVPKRVERKSSADDDSEPREGAGYLAKGPGPGGKKKKRELDRYL